MRYALNKGAVESMLVAVDDVPYYEDRGWKVTDYMIHVMLGGPGWESVRVWRELDK